MSVKHYKICRTLLNFLLNLDGITSEYECMFIYVSVIIFYYTVRRKSLPSIESSLSQKIFKVVLYSVCKSNKQSLTLAGHPKRSHGRPPKSHFKNGKNKRKSLLAVSIFFIQSVRCNLFNTSHDVSSATLKHSFMQKLKSS